MKWNEMNWTELNWIELNRYRKVVLECQFFLSFYCDETAIKFAFGIILKSHFQGRSMYMWYTICPDRVTPQASAGGHLVGWNIVTGVCKHSPGSITAVTVWHRVFSAVWYWCWSRWVCDLNLNISSVSASVMEVWANSAWNTCWT